MTRYDKELQTLIEEIDIGKICEEEFDKQASDFTNRLRGNAPVDTGKLKESIRKDKIDEETYYITVNTDYAVYANYGRGDVYPVNKKVLRFKNPNGSDPPWIFTKHSKPFKGHHFIEETIEEFKNG